jgi:hypothetical protein
VNVGLSLVVVRVSASPFNLIHQQPDGKALTTPSFQPAHFPSLFRSVMMMAAARGEEGE